MLTTLAQSFWLPEGRSTFAEGHDWVFWFIFAISLVFAVGILGSLVLFIWRYHHTRNPKVGSAASHNTALELTWTILPTAIVIVIFFFGFRGFLDLAQAPKYPYEINVTAFKWGWSFEYPNGYTDQNLHVPKDRPIRLVLSSRDVIHSLYVPAFRVKKDTVPGRFNVMWFEATEVGEYDLFCAEYCGTKHSAMIAKVIVHDETEFENWLAEAARAGDNLSPAARGARLYQAQGCVQCHSVDGTRGIGPTFKDLYGLTGHPLVGGETVTVDENYIRHSILEPGDQIVAGFDNVMPSYAGGITEGEISDIIAYMKSVSVHYDGPPLDQAPAEGDAEGEGASPEAQTDAAATDTDAEAEAAAETNDTD